MRIDTFTSLDDLKPRDRRNANAVLAVLRNAQRFSVFEHEETLDTIVRLKDDGRIRYTNRYGYPWQSVEVVSDEERQQIERAKAVKAEDQTANHRRRQFRVVSLAEAPAHE